MTNTINGGNSVSTGVTHKLSARVRTTIQSIKEIVGNFSDSDIYVVLKETNMDPNETTQKLLNQDPFHVVKRRDKKKEPTGDRGSTESRKNDENSGQAVKPHKNSDRNAREAGFAQQAGSSREAGFTRQAGFARPSLPGNAGISREFRIVRDNRTGGNVSRESKTAQSQGSKAASNQGHTVTADKGGLRRTSSNIRPPFRQSFRTPNGPVNPQSRYSRYGSSLGAGERKVVSENDRNGVTNSDTQVQAVVPNNSQNNSATLAASSSVIGVYSSSTDPVHVPSPDSRSPAAIGAIKREVGVVGGRRPAKDSNASNHSFSDLVLAKDSPLTQPFQPLLTVPKVDQASQTSRISSVMPGVSGNKSVLSNHVRPHKASYQNKEWKPKSGRNSSATSPSVVESAMDRPSSPVVNSKDAAPDVTNMEEKLLQRNVCENQNVIIAQHIRVAEVDKCKLTFGSFGVEQASGFQGVRVTKESHEDSTVREDEQLADRVKTSESNSPASDESSDSQLSEEASIPPTLDNYEDIGLVSETNPSNLPEVQQQQQDETDLPTFSAYDPQTAYDITYLRPQMDETLHVQGLPSPQEVLMLPAANNVPTSSVPMVQQQQQLPPQMAQMYPQLHVPPFANMVPYRQLFSPLYLPQVPMPGYSSNAAYPHHSNGSNYVLIPGGGSHISANGLKYGVQQFKPVPGSSPTGYGNFSSPNGYVINAPGVVGNAAGLEDSARVKFKDGNLYVPNPQTETSEIWIQNPRELPGLQTSPYYNMSGQTPHGAYLPSLTGHASFNGAAAQSSHMQYPGGLYPPPPPAQPTAMMNPHHLGPVMGGNVGAGVNPAAPGSQLGAYQQPQLGHLNWTANF